jgi:hypothetical protein
VFTKFVAYRLESSNLALTRRNVVDNEPPFGLPGILVVEEISVWDLWYSFVCVVSSFKVQIGRPIIGELNDEASASED